ncbi:MAG: hypothetical protein JXO51_11590 [Candidatus Aminicenantes bacterium]|nr:hypothetical protein [Candidatus Aminicenantes bacterium]
MKKVICLGLAGLALLAGPLPGEDVPRVLAMELPADMEPGKNALWVNLAQLQALGGELASMAAAGDIALLDGQNRVLLNLGSIRKGKCRWKFKTIQGRFLEATVAAEDYARLAPGIVDRVAMRGFQLAAFDDKTRSLIHSIPVVFWDMADLAVQLDYPVNASPGQRLAPEVTVQLENRGGLAAEDVRVDILMSLDERIGQGDAGDDIPLENGRQTVPRIEAGQQVAVRFAKGLRIPETVPPGKRYLAVVADPEDRIVELGEENNVHAGFILISVPEPAAFTVELPETVLHFEPADYGFRIVCADTVISDGKDWKLCRMKPNVYQIQHVSWSGFFWEIDTQSREVFEISGASFCKKGGKDRELGIRVEVTGGSLLQPPSRFTLKLKQTRLRFEPAAKKFSLLAYEKPIFHLPFWWVCRRESYLYQIRCALWQNFFWQIDTFAGEASKVTDGKFCSAEGIAAKMPFQVTVEKK